MEQRRLRLGDILDDYCPRERRVTNHLVVAMIDDEVKQTRCSTCDADHEYRQARVPPPRRRKETGVLAVDVADTPRARRPDPVSESSEPDVVDAASVADVADLTNVTETASDENAPIDVASDLEGLDRELELDAAGEPEPATDDPPPPAIEDDGPVHRRLIRATLPRPEGQVPERREPEFTVRQQGSGGRGREVDGNRPPQGQGKRHRRPQRSGGEQGGEMRFGGQPNGNNRRGQGAAFQNQRSGRPGGSDTRPQGGGEGRFRRRRGR